MAAETYSRTVNTSPWYFIQLRKFTAAATLTLFAFIALFVFTMPLYNMILTALKSEDQMVISGRGTILPVSPQLYPYENVEYPVYTVPTAEGDKQLALVKKGRQAS